MALATATITYDLADLIGNDFDPRRVRIWATTNIPGDKILDTQANKIRLGDGAGTLNQDGTGSITLWVPGAGAVPATWQYVIHVDHPQRGRRDRRRIKFGPFTLTGSADLADLEAEDGYALTYADYRELATYYAETETARDATVAARDAAVTARNQAVAAKNDAEALVISDLGTTDGQTRALIEAPASQTAQALSATFVPVVTPQAHEAVGDGLADDTAALQAAINAAAGGTLVVTKRHKINGTLTYTSDLPLTIEMREGAEVTQFANAPHFQSSGAAGASRTVTGGATSGSRVLTLATGHGFAAGDYILVTSDDLIPGVTTAEGMMRRVVASTSTTITLDSALYITLPTAPRVHKLSLRGRLLFTGPGKWRQDTPATKTREMFDVTLAMEPTWRGVTIEDGGGPGVQVTHCEGGSFSGIVRRLLNYPASSLPSPDTAVTHYGYAINARGATRGFRLHDGLADNVRHGFTTSGNPATSAVDAGRGGPEGCRVERSFRVTNIPGPVNASTGNREISSALDTHEQGWGNVLDGTVDGCLTGFTDRARNTRIGGHVRGHMYGVIVLPNASGATVETVVEGVASSVAGQSPAPFSVRLESPTTLGAGLSTPAVSYGPGGYGKRPDRHAVAGDRILVRAVDFDGCSGSYPTKQVHGAMTMAMQYVHTANGSAGTLVDIPEEWQEFALYLWVVNPTASSGDVRLAGTTADLSPGATVTSGITTSPTITHTVAAQNIVQRILLADTVDCPETAKYIRIDRVAAEAADTLEDSYRVLAVELVRLR